MESGFRRGHQPRPGQDHALFIDRTGFTRFTEQEGDETAFSVVEQFTEAVEATLPPEAGIVKTIGDEGTVVSPDPASRLNGRSGSWPCSRTGRAAGRHPSRCGRIPGWRPLRQPGQPRPPGRQPGPGGEVLITDAVAAAIEDHPDLETDTIGESISRASPVPTPLFLVRARS